MSLYEEDDFINRDEVELDNDELTGLIMVPGQLVFEDAYEVSNGGNDDYAEKYSVTGRLPKGNDFAKKLFAVCDHIGKKTWKGEFEEKMEVVWGGVESAAAKTNISIVDGDLVSPQYNKGHWQFKATRREDEGQPEILLPDGTPIEWDSNSKDSVRKAQKIGPKKGDYCYFLIRVWCQKKRERINLSLEGIQLVERGTLRVQKVDRKQIQGHFGKAKPLPTGFVPKAIPARVTSHDDDEEIEAEVIESEEDEEIEVPVKKGKPAPTKAVARAKPTAKKAIFRGKRK